MYTCIVLTVLELDIPDCQTNLVASTPLCPYTDGDLRIAQDSSSAPCTTTISTTPPSDDDDTGNEGSEPASEPEVVCGRIEIWSSATGWGTICDDGWDDKDADVACRQMGYDGGYALASADRGGPTVPSETTTWAPVATLLSEVACDGDEEKLYYCDFNYNQAEFGCSHKEDAGVKCYRSMPPGPPMAPPSPGVPGSPPEAARGE